MAKLTILEKALKEVYLACPELELQVPFHDKVIPKNLASSKRLILEQIFSEFRPELSEHYLIEEDADIQVIRHIRYLPANYHAHEFFEMIYVLNGSCYNFFENQTYELKKGDVVIIAPRTTHAISGFTDDLEAFNILIRKSTFNASFFGLLEDKDILSHFFLNALYENSKRFLYFHTKPAADLSEGILLMTEEINKTDGYTQRMLKNILDTFFIRLLRGLQINQVSLDTEAGEESEIIDMLQYLQNHFAEVSIADLSKKFNYSQRQIARILKNKTGKTFSQLILEMKISKAKVYLKQTNLPIQEIAELVGYGDLSNFYRYFFKVTGCSPKQFREMN